MKKFKKDVLEWLENFKSKGGTVTTYVCPHCESTLETPQPTKNQVGSKGYWDSMKSCYECEKPSFVKTFPNGKTEILQHTNDVHCPECLKKSSNEELYMFNGLCEECSKDA